VPIGVPDADYDESRFELRDEDAERRRIPGIDDLDAVTPEPNHQPVAKAAIDGGNQHAICHHVTSRQLQRRRSEDRRDQLFLPVSLVDIRTSAYLNSVFPEPLHEIRPYGRGAHKNFS
jgi:hypothetical protein